MSAVQLMRALETRGVRLSVRNGKLLCAAPPGSVTPDLKEALAAHKAEIIAALSYQADLAPPDIHLADRNADLPLSFAQRRLWFLHQLQPHDASYNIPAALRLIGDLNVAAVIAATNEIIARHEVLRTTLTTTSEGEARQQIAPTLRIDAPMVDLSTLAEEVREPQARKLVEEEAQRPFDLAQGPLLRVLLVDLGVRHGEREHVVAITMHHIVSDGWSTQVFIREFVALYEAFCAGRPSPLEKLKVQYADYAAWQRQWLQGEVLQRQLSYWRAQLAAAPQVLELPTDRPRPPVQDHAGAIYTFSVAKETLVALRRVGQSQGATLFMTLLAAFQLLLSRLSGQDDICVGVPIANRRRLELESLIGFFVNTLVLRTQVLGSERFDELLARVRDTALGAQEHQDLPFERLVEELQPQRNMSVSPLFQATFDLQTAPVSETSAARLRARPVVMPSVAAKFDLSLTMAENENSLDGSFAYATALFDEATVGRFATYYVGLLEQIAARPNKPVGDLPLISDTDRRQLLSEWNSPPELSRTENTLHELFEAQTISTPENVAVIFEDQRLTYRELNSRANQLAHWLRRRGVAAEGIVALCFDASLDMIVGLLAVLKAGGAYLPLDPKSPPERLALVVEDAAPLLVLTQQCLRQLLPEQAEKLCLDTNWSALAAEVESNPCAEVSAQNLAYVIYTSGSTGRPKGVCVPHGAIVNLAQAQATFLALRGNDRVLQFASISFDLATEEIFSTLARGATLVICAEKAKAGWTDFLEFVASQGLTALYLPTSFWSQLAGWMAENRMQAPSTLRLLCVGGEKASADALCLWRGLVRNDARWINHYGPTEAAVATTVYELDHARRDIRASVPIGLPIENTQVHLVDARLNLVPVSVAGEIGIGGVGLARGYLNHPDLTAASFIPDPFGPPGARLYRTGDLGRRRASGEIEFIRRLDDQMKIRGFRIEPGEIEAALVHLPRVRDALVLADEDGSRNQRLIAYVTPSEGARLDASELRGALQGKLPEYMIPSVFTILDSFPLTVSGKVDRKALPRPSLAAEGDHPRERPRSLTEWLLAKEFREILETVDLGIHDNFFQLGGNSLSALKLADRIRKTLFSSLPVTAIFQAQTIAELARWITDGQQRMLSPVVLMCRGGEAPPLFLIHPAGGSIIRYRALASALAPTRPIYGIQAWSVIDPSRHPSSIEDMAEDYVSCIRAVHPRGPYCLLGWSMGGATAMAMASALEKRGAEVGFIGLLDVTQPTNKKADMPLESPAQENTVLNYLRSFSRVQRVIEKRDGEADLEAVLTPVAVEHLAEVSARLSDKERFIYAAMWGQQQGLWDNVSEELMESLYAEQVNSGAIIAKFTLPRVRAPIHVWWTETTLQACGGAPIAWEDHTESRIVTTVVSGDHESVVEDPTVHKGIDDALRNVLS